MQSVKVEAPVLPPSEQQEVFQSVPVDQQNHPMYQFDPNSMIDPTENFKKFMTQFEEGDIPNIRGWGRGFFRGMMRGRGRGRGKHFSHHDHHHHHHEKHYDDRDQSSSSSGSREKHHKKKKKCKKFDDDFKEEQRRKIIVVSDHKGFIPGKVGEFVPVEVILENQSSKGVPRNTYVCKATKQSEIKFVPINLDEKLRSGHNRSVTIMAQLPETPGEYRCSFKFCIKQKKEIGTRFDLCFLAHEGEE